MFNPEKRARHRTAPTEGFPELLSPGSRRHVILGHRADGARTGRKALVGIPIVIALVGGTMIFAGQALGSGEVPGGGSHPALQDAEARDPVIPDLYPTPD